MHAMGVTKYSKGDIFIHRNYPHTRRLVLFVSFNGREVTYTIQNIEIDKADYTPSPISEADLDKYYYLSPSNILRTRIFIKYWHDK
jgi:hypothetical protein